MTRIFLADIRIYNPNAEEPPQLDTSLTGNTDIWVWPTLGVEDFNLPERGDYIIFFKSNPGISRLVGIGQALDIAHSATAVQALEEAGFETDLPGSNVLTIVNYQPVSSRSKPHITDIIGDSADLAKGMALRLVPSSVTEEYGFETPLQAIAKIDGLSTQQFTHLPDSPEDRGFPPNGPEEGGGGDDGGDGNGIDRTGPLLEQQYTARDAIREASTSGLQITILLFGVIVAGLSFLRDSLRNGVVEVSNMMLLGAAGIGIGAVLSAGIIVVSTTNPRPRITEISKEQDASNAAVFGTNSRGRATGLLRFSNFYHHVVRELRSSNAILGGLTGGAVGIALAGIFLIGYEVLQQIESLSPYPISFTFVFILASVLLAFYAMFQAFSELELP